MVTSKLCPVGNGNCESRHPTARGVLGARAGTGLATTQHALPLPGSPERRTAHCPQLPRQCVTSLSLDGHLHLGKEKLRLRIVKLILHKGMGSGQFSGGSHVQLSLQG